MSGKVCSAAKVTRRGPLASRRSEPSDRWVAAPGSHTLSWLQPVLDTVLGEVAGDDALRNAGGL